MTGPVACEKHSMSVLLTVLQQRSAEPSGACQPGGHGSHEGGGAPHTCEGQASPGVQSGTEQTGLAGAEQAVVLPSDTQQVPGDESGGEYWPGGQVYVQLGGGEMGHGQFGSFSGQLQTGGGDMTTPPSAEMGHGQLGSFSGQLQTGVGTGVGAQSAPLLREQQVRGSG
jgi:hypothetical protein